jgi:hypothetical protein
VARAERPLRPREGLTLAVVLPKGVLAEPSRLARFVDRASDYVGLSTALPLLVPRTAGPVGPHPDRL